MNRDPAPTKRNRHHGDLRAALIAAGLDLLDTDGIDAVTIRACARAVGVSHAAPVNHFPDLRALLTALALHCMTRFEAANRAAAAAADSPRGKVEAIFAASLAFAEAHPHRYRLMFRADLLAAQEPAFQAQSQAVVDVVSGAASGLAPPRGASRETLMVAICSLIHGYVSMRIDGNFEVLPDEVTGRPRYLAMLDTLLV